MSTQPTATYARMDAGTVEDYAIMGSYHAANLTTLPDRLMAMLVELGDKHDGSPLDGYAHSLQSATLAYDDGADDEMVFAALMHDIGQVASEHNHAEVAAAILKPFLSERMYWVVKHHGTFQGYYYFDKVGWDRDARDQHKDSPYYQDCIHFCERYDQIAFRHDYPTKPLTFFEPLVRRIVSAGAAVTGVT
jgi:predicted HD phosphohydrolase